MQVKSQKTQQSSLPFLLSHSISKQRDHDCKEKGVQRVVISGEPEQRVLGVACENLWNDAEAIDVGHDRRERDEHAVPAVQPSNVRQQPPRQEVRDWTHENGRLPSVLSELPIAR